MIYALDSNYIISLKKLQEQKEKLFLAGLFEDYGKPELVKNSSTAKITISGVLTKNDRYYGSTYEDLEELLTKAENDPEVETIEFYINSPGGEVNGIERIANRIKNSPKKTVAKVDYLAASAAYWLASATDEIIATGKLASFGSVGVIVTAYDFKEYFEKMGIKEVVLTSADAPEKNIDIAGKEGQEKIVERLNKTHAIFAEFVATQRNTTSANVNENYGKGSVLIAQEALKVGMIDKIILQQSGGIMEKEKQGAVEASVENHLSKDEIMKHLNFLGHVDYEKIRENIKNDKPYIECIEAYVEEKAENKFKRERIEDNKLEPQLSTKDKNKETERESVDISQINKCLENYK